MTIHYEGHRLGLTVNPPIRDEATGEIIEGSEQVVDTRIANWHHEPNEADPSLRELADEISQEDPDHPDYRSIEVRLADASDEINNATFAPNPDVAAALLSYDNGDAPTDLLVQHLAYRAYNGDLTPEEAFVKAIDSGHSPELLLKSYNHLKEGLN